jgi:hypothetical protein
MRKVTNQILSAFYNNESKTVQNTKTDGKAIYLYGNKIAEKRPDGIYVTNAGWKSNTTKERLNSLSGVSIQSKNLIWYLNGKEWNGDWIKI